jgi:hypothetical protein
MMSQTKTGVDRDSQQPGSARRLGAVVPIASLLFAAARCGATPNALSTVETEGGVFEGDDGGGASGVLSVSVDPATPVVCPGQCVNLTAAAVAGTPPYSYKWTGGVTGTAPTQRICPTATTTYSITATDSSGHGGELATSSARATASATVTVTPTCKSADAGPIATDGLTICSHTWTATPEVWSSTSLVNNTTFPGAIATDAQGDILVAESLVQSNGQAVGFVEKLDPQCNVLWTKQYVAQTPPALIANVVPVGIGTDGSGNVVVAGTFSGNIDFGDGTRTGSNADVLQNGLLEAVTNSSFLLKLDPQGNTLWSKSFANDANLVWTQQVAVDRAGNVDLAITGPPGLDLGGGALAASATDDLSYAARFAPDGTYTFGQPLPNLGLFSVATNASGAIWLIGTANSDGTVNWGSATTSLGDGQAALAELTGSGGYGWSTVVAPALTGAVPNVVVDGAGSGVIALEDEQVTAADGGPCDSNPCISSRTLVKVSSTGATLWTDATSFADESPSASAPQWLALDGSSNVFVGGEFQGTLAWGAVALTSAGESDVYVRILDPSGNPKGALRWGGAGADHLSALTTDPAGNAVILGVQGQGDGDAVTMFVAKIAP